MSVAASPSHLSTTCRLFRTSGETRSGSTRGWERRTWTPPLSAPRGVFGDGPADGARGTEALGGGGVRGPARHTAVRPLRSGQRELASELTGRGTGLG